MPPLHYKMIVQPRVRAEAGSRTGKARWSACPVCYTGSKMPVTKQDIQELLAAHKQGLVQEMDEHFAAQEKRLRTEVKGVEQRLTTRFQRRLKETKQSLRQAMQQQARRQDKLFETLLTNLLKYEFGKQTDWMTRHFNVLAQQLKQTHSAVTHTLERQGSPPLA